MLGYRLVRHEHVISSGLADASYCHLVGDLSDRPDRFARPGYELELDRRFAIYRAVGAPVENGLFGGLGTRNVLSTSLPNGQTNDASACDCENR